MKRRLLIAGAMALGVAFTPAHAQDDARWRSVDFSRQLHDTTPQRIHVQYGAGQVDVRASTEPLLYAMHLRYDETRATPLHRYDAEQHDLELGLESRAGRLHNASKGDGGELRLALPSSVALDINLELGGTQANLELGGLMLQSMRLECGATEATMSFATPNRSRMRELDVDVGAAKFTAVHLANANADQLRLRGGIGTVDLDFSGAWTRDLVVSTRLVVGKLTLRLPSDVGVRVEVQRVAAGFDHEGLVKRDDAWYSENWDTAPHKLRVRAETFFGGIDVRRLPR